MRLAPVTPDVPGFDQLLVESLAHGHRMLARFAENWRSGSNLFKRPGKCMLGLWDENLLAGVCGRNIDPYDPDPRAGRVRHLYVANSFRGQGAGRQLIDGILDGAFVPFDYLNTNAPETAFAFYERIGFEPLPNVAHVTHRLMLGRS